MARSKELHVVGGTWAVTQGNDPTTALVNDQFDLSIELSKRFGKNIRQGHAFRIVGYQAYLTPLGAGDADTGIAAAVELRYAPVTKHSVRAWRQMFTKWKKQKQLSGKVGQYVRYDDFELCYAAGLNTGRTSKIYAGGLGDTNEEYISIYDSASSGVRTGLADMYNSYQPVDGAGTDEFGVSIKDPKFTQYFPVEQRLSTVAHLSSIAQWTDIQEDGVIQLDTFEADPDSVHFMGASAGAPWVMLPADNHISVLAGLFRVLANIMPPDVDTGDNPPNAETSWGLHVNFMVEGWSPLAEGKSRK